MDEEENFAKLLSQSTVAPTWNAPSPSAEADPWANPFSDSTSNPFTSPFGTSSTYIPAAISDPYTSSAADVASGSDPTGEISPYVAKIEEDQIGRGPDMPSVIAARERDQTLPTPFESTKVDEELDDDDIPFGHRQGLGANFVSNNGTSISQQKKSLPSDLIDEDLLAASDPSLSLKKAFVKSAPSTKKETKSEEKDGKPKAYVFSPANKSSSASKPVVSKSATSDSGINGKEGVDKEEDVNREDGKVELEREEDQINEERKATKTEEPVVENNKVDRISPQKPASIPLPESTITTPTATRATSPAPVLTESEPIKKDESVTPSNDLKTPTIDRVAVSPLDPPPQDSDYGFQSLSIGASSSSVPALPPKSPTKDESGWNKTSSPSVSRFAGKGWGAMDDEDQDDGGLFGKGGPSVRAVSSDPWGGGTTTSVSSEGGWGEPGIASLDTPTAGLSTVEPEADNITPPLSTATTPPATSSTPRTPKVLSKPLFQITVGDPTRVGDPVRGYTVYTVKTKTTSPHYRKGEFSVLRRFSDFLWLFETLTMNNPGVIVPPVPDKHPFGRFQDTFIETRRLALERCLTKITGHPVLQLDPDLRLFLESDHFAAESKSRRAEFQDGQQSANKGLLASWTGPRFVEQDDWFDSRRSFLDSLENQLKGLSKSIEAAGKQRLDMATSLGDFASSMNALADSDLGSAMCAALARLSDLANREKEANEEQAKAEVVHLLNLSDEYVRFIGSVRLAFASRIKCYEKWQAAEKEVGRLRSTREKARQQGKLGERGPQTLAEVGEAERRSRDMNNEFEAVSKLVKSEFGRFEKERVEEFKNVLEKYLDGMIVRQKELIQAWEEYHGIVLGMVKKNQASLANGD